MRTIPLMLSAAMAAAVIAVVSPAAVSIAAPSPPTASREQAAFAAAAGESGVPVSVLMALSYAQTRWEAHAGQPSTSGGFGPMHLLDAASVDARGAAQPVPVTASDLQRAATLIGQSAAAVRTDASQNIRAGATLLAAYAREVNGGRLPATVGGWYSTVAKFSGATGETVAREYADDVYATLRTGATATTQDGQSLTLAAQPTVAPERAGLAALRLTKTATVSAAECPRGLDCRFIPAAYQLNSANPGDYGVYDTANRPSDVKIRYIVIHDTEVSYDGTIALFQNPKAGASAHYVIRSSDGQVTQMVHTKDVAWHAGNWYVNMHSIGIEHEGFAIQGGSWYTEAMYRSSARLVRYLAERFDVPLDRAHIIGHDNVPGPTPGTVAGMHWDPGPFWNWSHYMALLGAPIHATAAYGSDIVTINPHFATNQPIVTGCGTPPAACPAQGASFVYLHTTPNDTAPLLSDPVIHPDGSPGTTNGSDTSDKAATGHEFAVAGRAPGWTAIWFGGKQGWFRDSEAAPASVATSGRTISPLPGAASAPVYGRAYPEAAAYPAGVTPQAVVPLQYTIPAGQRYVLAERHPVRADYYYAKTIDNSIPFDHSDFEGSDLYYLIYFGHRIAYVRAADVVLN
ncbi:MAG: peptidoglycan recognition family protein [Pseudonocardiales bacterium]